MGIPIFKGWSASSMEQLYRQFKIETFRKDKVFYKENEPSSDLYFIKEGEIEVKFFLYEKNLQNLKYYKIVEIKKN